MTKRHTLGDPPLYAVETELPRPTNNEYVIVGLVNGSLWCRFFDNSLLQLTGGGSTQTMQAYGIISHQVGGWAALDNADHAPVNLGLVSEDGNSVTIIMDLPQAPTKVNTFLVAIDDSLANLGFQLGAGAGVDSLSVTFKRNTLYYTQFTATYNAGTGTWAASAYGGPVPPGPCSASYNAGTGVFTFQHAMTSYADWPEAPIFVPGTNNIWIRPAQGFAYTTSQFIITDLPAGTPWVPTDGFSIFFIRRNRWNGSGNWLTYAPYVQSIPPADMPFDGGGLFVNFEFLFIAE